MSMQFDSNNMSFQLGYSLVSTCRAPTVIVWPGYWLPEGSCSSLTVKVDGDGHASVNKDLSSGRVLTEGVRIRAYCTISIYHAKDVATGTHVKIHVGARDGAGAEISMSMYDKNRLHTQAKL